MVTTLDPHETDIVTYSQVVAIFTSSEFTMKHRPLDGGENMDLTILEKYVTQSIENEESQHEEIGSSHLEALTFGEDEEKQDLSDIQEET